MEASSLMDVTSFDCPHCEDIALKQSAAKDAVRVICPRCHRILGVMWLKDPEPQIAGQMSVYDYPESAA